MLDVPVLPSVVAVIVADPAPTPVTSPVALTVATPLLLLVHVTTRPARALPLASRGVAMSCTVPPCATLADAGTTSTDATGTSVTVMLAVPLFPSLVAVIVTDPTAAAVTSPFVLTVATAALLLIHATERPESGWPLASCSVAPSCTVPPIATVPDGGVTVTVATGASITVTLASPLFPSLVAVIAAEPAAIPVTLPFASTLAVPLALLDQVIDGPESGVPFESCGVATSCSTPPTSTVPDCGVTTTVATEAAGLVATGRSHAPATTAASSSRLTRFNDMCRCRSR